MQLGQEPPVVVTYMVHLFHRDQQSLFQQGKLPVWDTQQSTLPKPRKKNLQGDGAQRERSRHRSTGSRAGQAKSSWGTTGSRPGRALSLSCEVKDDSHGNLSSWPLPDPVVVY